ncbi:MAG: hypothetical protein QM496_02195 [Verrucomicrobiota bacterium]
MKLIERLMFLVIPSCRETQKLQSKTLDEKLPWLTRCSLWMHCVMCGWCRRYGKQLKFLSRACGDLPECGDFEKDEALPEEAKERIARCLCEAEAGGKEAVSADVVDGAQEP